MDALCYAMRLFMWVFPVYPLKKQLPEGSFPKIAFQPRIQIKAKILPEWDSVIRASEIISILVGPYARWEKLVGWKDFKTWNAKEKLYHKRNTENIKSLVLWPDEWNNYPKVIKFITSVIFVFDFTLPLCLSFYS